MSDTPKFEVIDRRKFRLEDEDRQADEATATPAPPAQRSEDQPAGSSAAPEPSSIASGEKHHAQAGPQLVESASEEDFDPISDAEMAAGMQGLPPAPTEEESREQKVAYQNAAQRLEDLVRAQNPAAGAQPPVTFENLVQQLYLSAMIQMGAGTQEGQRPRVDILGAKQTIDLMGVLLEKTGGNLSSTEQRTLETVLFEARMAFLELTNMISMPAVPASPPPGKR